MLRKLRNKVKRTRSSRNPLGGGSMRNRTDTETQLIDYLAEGVYMRRSISEGQVNRVSLQPSRDTVQNYYTVSKTTQSFRLNLGLQDEPSFFEETEVIVNQNIAGKLRSVSTLSQSLPTNLNDLDSLEERRNSNFADDRVRSVSTVVTQSEETTSDVLNSDVAIRPGREYDVLPVPTDPGIPKKHYLGKYQSSDESALVDDDMEVFKQRRKSSKKKKKSSRLWDSFLGSKKPKTEEKENTKKSCLAPIKTLEDRASRSHASKTKKRATFRKSAEEKSHCYTETELEDISLRRADYNNMNLSKNACIAQLQLALKRSDTHMFKVDVEKDQAYGLGLYLYGIGPDRLVPYVSIFVKEVVQGGKIDKQGMIKPHDQIIKCGNTSFVGIKQEDALRIMKNRPSLSLVMGRRTKNNNQPITKQDHKDILSSSTPELWWTNPLKLESGDFRLLEDSKAEQQGVFNVTSRSYGSPTKVNIDLSSGRSRLDSQRSEGRGGCSPHTPNTKPPSGWLERQEFLESKVNMLSSELDRERSQKERALQEKDEIIEELRRFRTTQDFNTRLIKTKTNAIEALCSENVELRLGSRSQEVSSVEDTEHMAHLVFGVRHDLSSLNNDDTCSSFSTTRHTPTNLLPYPFTSSGLQDMERITGEVLDGSYVNIGTGSCPSPFSTGSETTRYTYDSNYSSRRGSTQFSGSNRSSTANLSSVHSLISGDEDEQTPMNDPLEITEIFENDLSDTHSFHV